MEQLPIELIEKILILDVLTIQDVIHLSLTSKHFQNLIVHNNSIWKSKFRQKFPGSWHKLEDKPASYYEELRHVYQLRIRTRTILNSMVLKFYGKIELSNENLSEWEEIIREKWGNYFYLLEDLMHIIDSKCDVVTMNPIPLNTPGNLTQKYYAIKVLRFIRQLHLESVWFRYISMAPEHRLWEDGATLVAQWCQPNINIDVEVVRDELDKITEMVKNELSRVCPNHPVLKATKKQFEQWKLERRPDNEWVPEDCRLIISATNEVLFEQLRFKNYNIIEPPSTSVESDAYINVVLKTKKGLPAILIIIYEAVVRRLGLKCDLIFFPSHVLLRFCESQRPGADCYYIDVSSEGRIVRTGTCPFSSGMRVPGPKRRPESSPEEVIAKIAKDVAFMARQQYNPSGKVTKLRSAFELAQVINPNDIRSLSSLATLYMQYNFNTQGLEKLLIDNNAVVRAPEVRALMDMLRTYRPDPHQNTTIEPVRRHPFRNEVKYAVGMVMAHKIFGYKCVIFNWDSKCVAAVDWKVRNNISSLEHKHNQPFYNVLAQDDSHRYVAQENLYPIHEPKGLRLDSEVGKYFTHYYKTYYVPNAQTEAQFPDDGPVRNHFHELVLQMPVCRY